MFGQSYRKACQLAVQRIKDIAVRIDETDEESKRQMLERVAGTALNSKLIARHKPFFTPMVRGLVFTLPKFILE